MKTMTLSEFINQGYLQELNRQFLHPHGLALSVNRDNEVYSFGDIIDARNEKEGIIFEPGQNVNERVRKMNNIKNIEKARRSIREEKLGYWIQPIEQTSEVILG